MQRASFTPISLLHSTVNRWSCVRNGAVNAWNYNSNGFANANNFYNGLTAVPVTKLKNIMEIHELYTAYLEARRGKRRSMDQVQFELHLFERLQKLCDAVNNGTLPTSSYCFIHRREKSREVWACDMELKILQTILDKKLRPIVERELTDCTFNNRKGKGTMAAVNHVIEHVFEASRGYTRDCWIIKLDLKGYFPNINQDIAWESTRRLIEENFEGEERDALLLIARHVNYLNPQFNTERRSMREAWNEEIVPYKSLFSKPFGMGAAIGFLYWQVMSNLYLNEADKWIIEHITPYYTRFVDDMVFVTTNKELTLAALPRLRERLDALGVRVHPRKFYCQHYTKGVEFLGYHLKPWRVHLNRKIVRRAFRLHTENTGKFVCQVNSYLGMMKAGSDSCLARRFLEGIDRDDVIVDFERLSVRRKRRKLRGV